MKKFRIDNLIKIFLLILLILILSVYVRNADKSDYGQAQRIAMWKSIYEELNYCFDLVNLYEGTIVPAGERISAVQMKERLLPYFNVKTEDVPKIKRYRYKKRNRSPLRKDYPYYFNDFFITKTGVLLSVKENKDYDGKDDRPGFFMMVDVNGLSRPNRIGKDIFFINIFKDKVNAAGYGAERAQLKTNCSPVGSGVYCSQYYLLGGKF